MRTFINTKEDIRIVFWANHVTVMNGNEVQTLSVSYINDAQKEEDMQALIQQEFVEVQGE